MEKNIFNLNTQQLKDIAVALQDKIEAGLEKEGTEILCLPTYITPKTDGVTGEALVLDLGGTNYRVAVVNFDGDSPSIHPADGWKRDLTKMKSDGFTKEDLFKEMAEPIPQIYRKGKLPIGYCFSYPASSLPDGDATLLRWTKGVKIDNMIGQPVGKPLRNYFNKIDKVGFSDIKVINDTVAALFAGVSRPGYDSYIGLIVGTGTNMAPFMRADKIAKLTSKEISGVLPVNLESGNFQPPHLTKYDEMVNEASAEAAAESAAKVAAEESIKGAVDVIAKAAVRNPSEAKNAAKEIAEQAAKVAAEAALRARDEERTRQRFEKAISGMYLGEILKAVFPGTDFGGKCDASTLTNMMSYPDLYKQEYVETASAIYKRSADLVAASLAGLILVLRKHDKGIKRIFLTAEGGLYWSSVRGNKAYNEIVEETLSALLREFGISDVTVDVNRMDNANLIGTAVAALS